MGSSKKKKTTTPSVAGVQATKADVATTTPSVAGVQVTKADVASLTLVTRGNGSTEWAFSERANSSPPAASMKEPLCTIEAIGKLAGADPEKFWWWIQDEALDAMAAQLEANNHCVVDDLLGKAAMKKLRGEVAALHESGRLQLSKLAGGRTGGMLTYSHTAVRGDHVGWFDGEEGTDHWPTSQLSRYLQKVDTLVAQLGERVEQLAKIAHRSKAMIACYPGGGARYVRHCDNSCDTGHGDRCNGRRLVRCRQTLDLKPSLLSSFLAVRTSNAYTYVSTLTSTQTAILYLNENWHQLHGGELRLFPPYAKGAAVADVAPLADRLILFYADYRCPHEVLPAHVPRLAVTLWYFDKEEHASARKRGVSAEQTDSREAEAIEAEIARFEEKYGAGAVRHNEVGAAAGEIGAAAGAVSTTP